MLDLLSPVVESIPLDALWLAEPADAPQAAQPAETELPDWLCPWSGNVRMAKDDDVEDDAFFDDDDEEFDDDDDDEFLDDDDEYFDDDDDELFDDDDDEEFDDESDD